MYNVQTIHKVDCVNTKMVDNSNEKSWDCPYYGSRFDMDGKLLHYKLSNIMALFWKNLEIFYTNKLSKENIGLFY